MGPQVWLVIQLACTLVVAACLITSGIAKLRDPAGTEETFRALHVPLAIDRPMVRRAYPVIELGMGAGILLAPQPIWLTVGVTATVLLGILTFFVGRVLARGEAAHCNCFGSRQPVTGRTLARNLVFLAAAVAMLLGGGSAPLAVLTSL